MVRSRRLRPIDSAPLVAVVGVAALLATILAACGGATGAAANGRQLFVQTGCGACHTLKAAGTTGNIGPNLDDLKPGKSVVEMFVRDGNPPTMPAFGNRLSEDQIKTLADYVSKATGGDQS